MDRFMQNLPKNALIGMVHIGASPGAPYNQLTVEELVQQAVQEAKILEEGGMDALIIENMHDRPYHLRQAGPEVVATMTAVGRAIKKSVHLPMGVQVLAGANKEALAVALACDAQFVRAEGFVFTHITNSGLHLEASAGPLLRYRKAIGAEHIAIFADIKKKHASHSITNDLTIADTAREAVYCGADALIVTGLSTGLPTSPEECQAVKENVEVPVLVGSGTDPKNMHVLSPFVDGYIVGSYIKEKGNWMHPIDPKRVEQIMQARATCV